MTKWRLIGLEKHDAAMNMAIDQAISESGASGQSPATIRFYQWEKPAVSLGAYQALSDVDLGVCRERGIEIVRRMTGGRAVYHGTSDFTYCVVVPIKTFNYSITTAYRSVCNSILIALKKIGIKGRLEQSNDVMVDERKISGNAAKVIDSGWYLQHGAIHYELDRDLLSRLFHNDLKDLELKSTSILEHRKISKEDVYKALIEGFTSDKEVCAGPLTSSEILRAKDLAFMKYKNVTQPRGAYARPKGACSVLSGERI